MDYKEWRYWVLNLPWKFKWFIVLILVRPLIDLTWDMDIYLSISLLQIVGILTPVIIFFLFLTRKLPASVHTESPISKVFIIWSLLLILNAILIWGTDPSIDRLGISLKLCLPIFFYFFLRHFIASKRQLERIYQTIYYSLITPALLILYETIISPFDVYLTRDSVQRIRAGRADVVVLGYYINFALLIIGYFWLKNMDESDRTKKNNFSIYLTLGLCILGLLNINHTSSYFTFGALLIFFLGYASRKQKTRRTVVIMLVCFSIFFLLSKDTLQKRIVPLVDTDIKVIQGEKELERAFHGRIGRWGRHLGYFTEEISIFEQMIGIIGMSKPYMTTSGPHSDYLRILFVSGYLGFLVYIIMLLYIFLLSREKDLPEKFLIRGVLIIIGLMSVTTAATYYNHVHYIFISLIAYLVLPKHLKR